MVVLVQYDTTDGRILGTWQAATYALLLAQMGDAPLGTAYELVETNLPIAQLVTDAYMKDGELTAKAVLALTALPNPFPANGVTECHITVMPFMPCTLLVNGETFGITAMDETLVLTADSPQMFHVELAPIAAYRADPLTVEAT